MKICSFRLPTNHKGNYKFFKQVLQNDKEIIDMKNKKMYQRKTSVQVMFQFCLMSPALLTIVSYALKFR